MTLDLTSLRKAIAAMDLLLQRAEDDEFMSAQDDITRNGLRAGVIQHFEFTYELCWKFIQRWVHSNVSPEDADYPRTRKELFRHAARAGLISDPVPWFRYAEARNITSHTYDEEDAAAAYKVARDFLTDAQSLLASLESNND